MLDKKKFEFIKNKYGHWASWAIWVDEGEKPKSNVGDLSVFDITKNKGLLSQLKPNIILVGLNISRGSIKHPLANFHDARSEATDFKIRFALKGSPFWGGYMTDIIKDFDQKNSGEVAGYLKTHKAFEEENIKIFREEINDLGINKPTIIAFGGDTYSVLTRNLNKEFKILKISHYAHFISKEKYREEIKSLWNS